MRKLFLALFVLCSFFASAQKIQKVNTYGYEYNRFISDTLFALPGDTFAVPAAYQAYPFLARKATTLYVWNTGTFIWQALAGGSGSVDSLIYSTRAWRQKGDDSLGAVIAGRTWQQSLTAGSTLTTDNTIDFGGNDFILKGDSVVIKDPSGNERIRLLPNGNPSEGDATKIKLTNIDGATMIIQTGDEYLETLTGWVIRNTIGYNPVLSVNGASTGQTSPLIEVIQNLNDSIFTIISSGNVGIGDRTPDTSSLLDVSSTSKGVLIPRMTTTQRNAISLPAIGLMIYNTTDSAFNFYRASGWSAIGGGSGSYTFSNGLTEAAGAVKLGGTITENTQIYPDTEDAYNLDIGDPTTFRNIGIYAKNQLYIGTTNPATDWSSEIHFYDDSLVLRPGLRKLYVDSLDYTLSTTGKKILLRDTASGLVQNIDPALLGGGSTNTSVGSGYKVAIDGTNNIKSLTGGYGITLDSATSNQVGIKADTATLFPAVRATIPAGGWGLNGTSISYGNFLGTTSNNTLRFYTNGVYRWKIDSSSGALHNGIFTGNNASVAPLTISADAQEEVIHTYSSSGINGMTITKDGFKGINYIGTAISGASALKIKASATSATAHASSIIDIESTGLGILIPRMTETQRNAISSPATGLQIFNTTDSSINVKRGLSGWYTADLSLTGSAALDFGSTSAQTSADLTITVTGAADGDVVSLGVPNGSANANTNYTAWVSAANTVTVRFNNYSSGAIDPASGTFKVRVIK